MSSPFVFNHVASLSCAERVEEQHTSSKNGDFLTIDACKRQVHWYAAGGIRTVRQYSFANKPVDATFCYFETKSIKPSNNSKSCAIVTTIVRKNAVAVLLSNGDLHVHFFNGEWCEMHLSIPVCSMVSVPTGLLFQRQIFGAEEQQQFYYLSSAFSNLQCVDIDTRYGSDFS
jgi:hypothetical protein